MFAKLVISLQPNYDTYGNMTIAEQILDYGHQAKETFS